MSSFSHFFSKKFQHICVSLDLNFNESLTNDIVSFEQLGPACHVKLQVTYLYSTVMPVYALSIVNIWSEQQVSLSQTVRGIFTMKGKP